MKGERQAESHGAHRVPAPGGPCPHTRGLDVARESLRNRYGLRHISARLLRRGGVAALQIFTRGGGGTNNEEFRDTSGGAPSGFGAHETLVLAFLWGASEIKNFVSPTGAHTLENTEDDTTTQHAENVRVSRTPHLDRGSICIEKCRLTAEEVDPQNPKSVRP